MIKWVIGLIAAIFVLVVSFFYHFGVTTIGRKRRSVVLIRAGSFQQHEYIHECFDSLVQADPLLKREAIRAFVVPNLTDKMTASSVCKAALQEPADCVVVVGRTLSQITVNQAKRRKISTPIVFIGADKPVQIGLVDSLHYPGGTVTGLFTVAPAQALCGAILRIVCPDVKTVLLPYAISAEGYGAVFHRATAIKAYLKIQGVEVRLVGLEHSPDALSKIEVLLPFYDAVMTLEDDVFNEALIAGLGKLALCFSKVFFSGTGQALAEGAILTYGLELRYSVEAAVGIVKQILYRGKSPAEMPVLRLGSSRELIINTERARELGINLDLQALERAIATDPALVCVRGRVRVL